MHGSNSLDSIETIIHDDDCEGCDGSGVRVPASPSCLLNVVDDWIIVERCDTCQQFMSDIDAADSVFLETRWVTCASGGAHAIGRLRK